MHRLITAAEARAADEAAVGAGATWDGLMATAGHGLAVGVVDELRGRTGGVYGRRVVLLAGKGDNGGDAWVAARVLRDRGVTATVVAVHGVGVETSTHSARARAAWLDTGGRVVDGLDRLDEVLPAEGPPRAFPAAVVDAVLGTGLRGAARGEALEAIRATWRPWEAATATIAADIPSGVEADTGRAVGPAVRAHRTVTFGGWKRGLALHPGADHAGRVDLVELTPTWSDGIRGRTVEWSRLTDRDVTLPRLAAGADKRRRGRVLVVAGSQRYAGAGALAAAAAVRAGAGLVTLATTGSTAAVHALEPGVMAVPLPAAHPSSDGDVGGPSPEAAATVTGLAEDADVVVVGPGLGHGEGTRAVAEAVLDLPVTTVLDADGINVFRGEAAVLRQARGALVVTPHHRELARLLGDGDPRAVLDHRDEIVPRTAEALGAVVVGKGPRTIVAGPGHRSDEAVHVLVASSGGPALGTGGSGDVLAGLLGALLAGQGPFAPDRTVPRVTDTVAGGVQLHGLLGDRAGAAAGGRATARDLLEVLPAVFAGLVAGRDARADASARRTVGRAARPGRASRRTRGWRS